MNLIYYRGLNCHLGCVINIADSLGVNYLDAFGTLWSETDFTEDPRFHIYLSQRVFPNLEALGIKREVFNCASEKQAEESFSLIPEGELFVAGMDTSHIPWSFVYQTAHEPHYFYARKEKPDSLFCFDPTYNQICSRLAPGGIIPHAFELNRIHRTAASQLRPATGSEAREILRKHPETQETLRTEMNNCKRVERGKIMPLIRRITAMINNRYLFERFLQQYSFMSEHDQRFFGRDFFSRWEAVKNGMYKASILRNNESVIDETCNLFLNLMREETDMAKEMIVMESGLD